MSCKCSHQLLYEDEIILDNTGVVVIDGCYRKQNSNDDF